MSPAQPTTSQVLFERFCGEHGLGCKPIPVGRIRTADYLLDVRGHDVVAEVKQLDPNARDRASARAFQAGGVAEYGGEAGSRIRHLIDKGKKQLVNLARGRCPGVLVIYNNVRDCPTYTDPTFVMVAMYGHLTLDIALPPPGTGPPRVVALRHGSKNKVSPSSNTTLSAVCVIHTDDNDRVLLTFYHNRFAAIPFEPDWLRAPVVWHYGLPSGSPRSVRTWSAV